MDMRKGRYSTLCLCVYVYMLASTSQPTYHLFQSIIIYHRCILSWECSKSDRMWSGKTLGLGWKQKVSIDNKVSPYHICWHGHTLNCLSRSVRGLCAGLSSDHKTIRKLNDIKHRIHFFLVSNKQVLVMIRSSTSRNAPVVLPCWKRVIIPGSSFLLKGSKHFLN